MSPEQQQLEAAIRGLEAQRGLLGDAVVDASVAGLRAKLAALVAPVAAALEPAQADAALRRGFLQNIPHHREIVAAWPRRGAADGTLAEEPMG